jgi:spermidine synthase
VSKEYFRNTMSTAFGDPRLKLIIGDAAAYLKEHGIREQYDVIICDSSDPVGPADVLFQPEFFQSMHNALNPVGGIICTQGECQWLHLDLIRGVMDSIKPLFAQVKYAYTTIPTYPSGQIGFLVLSRDASITLNQASRPVPTTDFPLKYYSEEIHNAAFILPSK